LRCCDIGLGLVECDLEIAVVDAGQHLAGLHALVIADQHVDEITRDFRCNRRVVGLHIGVIGRDQEASDGPIVPAVPGGCGK